MNVNPDNTEIFLYKPQRPKSYLSLSGSFEYLCYGSTATIYIFTLSVRGSTLDVRRLTFNPLTAKLFNLNFHPLEVVSR